MEALIQKHKQDDRKLFGYYVFFESYMDTLQQMKSVDSLTLSDFKKYFRLYNKKITLTEKDSDIYNTGYLTVFSYNFQLISQSLYESGFNPLQTVSTIEPLYKKYKDNPEVQIMMQQSKR